MKTKEKIFRHLLPTHLLPILAAGGIFFTAMQSLLADDSATSVKIGVAAPSFTVKNIEGEEVTSDSLRGKIVVLEWFNPGCPYVKKHYQNSGNIPKVQKNYVAKEVVWIAVNSTNPNHRDFLDAKGLRDFATSQKMAATHIIPDPEGELGKLYGAKTTPHLFIIDSEGKLVYRGAIDSERSTKADDISSSTNYVAKALDAILAGDEVKPAVTQEYGCSVKYRK